MLEEQKVFAYCVCNVPRESSKTRLRSSFENAPGFQEEGLPEFRLKTVRCGNVKKRSVVETLISTLRCGLVYKMEQKGRRRVSDVSASLMQFR